MACQHGHEACARLLVDHGADVDRAWSDGATPLHIAREEDHVACAQMLVDGGANFRKSGIRGWSQLQSNVATQALSRRGYISTHVWLPVTAFL